MLFRSKPAYTLGKLLSNFAVLSAIVVVLALAAPVLVFFQGEGMRLGVMFSPFLLIALPAMAVVAAFAVLFETFRPLSGGAGNVLWFFVWNGIVALPLTAGWPKADMTGLLVLYQSMGAAARASFPDVTSPETGENRSLTAFTDSTTPNVAAWLSVRPTSGSSTKTMSPSWFVA